MKKGSQVSPIKSRRLGVWRCHKASFQLLLLLYNLGQENKLFCSSLSMTLRQTLYFSLPFAWVALIIVLPSSLVNITLEKTFPIITKPQVSLVVLWMQRLHILVKSCRINTGTLFSLQTFSLIKIEAKYWLFILHSKIRKLGTLNNLPFPISLSKAIHKDQNDYFELGLFLRTFLNNNIINGVKKLEQNLPFIRLDSSSMVIAPTANSSKSLTTWLCLPQRLVNYSIHFCWLFTLKDLWKKWFHTHIQSRFVSVGFNIASWDLRA